MQLSETAQVVAMVVSLWPNFTATEVTVPAWHALLADLDPVAVRAAVLNLARDGREFAPPPGVIYARVAPPPGDMSHLGANAQ